MNTSELLNIIFGIIGAVGVALSIWFYIKQKAEKEPQCYYKNYRNIVKLSEEDKLKIVYNGAEVDRVSTSYFFIWNKGRTPIRKEDIPSPIMLTLSDKYELLVLDYKVIKISRELINFSAQQCNKRALEIHFDFLDKNDGAVLEVKHTGSINTKPELVGAILGVPDGIVSKKIVSEKLTRTKLSRWYFYSLFALILLVIFLVSQVNPILVKERSFIAFLISGLIGVVTGAIILILPPIFSRWLPKNILPYPKTLDIDVDIKPY